MSFPEPPILDYRTQPTSLPHRPEIGRVLLYAVSLSAGWMLMCAGLLYVLIAIFTYVSHDVAFSPRALFVSFGVLGLTVVIGFYLYLLRPKR